MTVTTDVKASVVETMETAERCAWSDDALAEKCKSLRRLECRAWRILSHDASVEQWLPGIETQGSMVLAAIPAYHHTRVICGRRHHAEHFPRRRLYSHYAAYLPFHQPFSKRL